MMVEIMSPVRHQLSRYQLGVRDDDQNQHSHCSVEYGEYRVVRHQATHPSQSYILMTICCLFKQFFIVLVKVVLK